MNTINLKKVETNQDIEALFIVLKEIWEEVFTPIIGEKQVAYMMKNYQSIDNIKQEIEKGAQYYFLMYNQQAVGYTAYESTEDKIYISKIYIHQNYRGKGLMTKIFNWYFELGKGKTLYLNVNQGNQLAISVYEHFGFQQVGERYVDIGEGYIMNDFIYERVVI